MRSRRALLLMDIRPIKTHRNYRRLLEEIEVLMNAKRNAPEGGRLAESLIKERKDAAA
jgi:hypothetical protein